MATRARVRTDAEEGHRVLLGRPLYRTGAARCGCRPPGAAADELRPAGLDEIPSNDFSLYDHVLDTAVLLGAIPPRHAERCRRWNRRGRLDRYFAMARGTAEVAPLEMTKWFDTNYHYLVPEIGPDTAFALDAAKPLAEFARGRGGRRHHPAGAGRPGHASCCWPSPPPAPPRRIRPAEPARPGCSPCTSSCWRSCTRPVPSGCSSTSPRLVTDQPPAVLAAVEPRLPPARRGAGSTEDPGRDLLRPARRGAAGAAEPPVDGLAIDFTGPAAAQPATLAGARRPARQATGRRSRRRPQRLGRRPDRRRSPRSAPLLGLADRSMSPPSCSLLHVPHDVEPETDLDPQFAGWFAFARQKLDERSSLAAGLTDGADADRRRTAGQRGAPLPPAPTSPIVASAAVRARVAAVDDADLPRAAPSPDRRAAQQDRLRAAAAADHDDRLVPADHGAAPGPGRAPAPGRSTRAGYERGLRAEIAP